MTQPNTRLTIKKIVDHEFKTALKGYKQDEVDAFLDLVIKDYELLQKTIEDLQSENARLKKQNDDQKSRTISAYSPNTPDILRRLSHLEKHVFGNKLYE
ncbi:MAG: cell division regulator GpsB [Bacilli bacterium]